MSVRRLARVQLSGSFGSSHGCGLQSDERQGKDVYHQKLDAGDAHKLEDSGQHRVKGGDEAQTRRTTISSPFLPCLVLSLDVSPKSGFLSISTRREVPGTWLKTLSSRGVQRIVDEWVGGDEVR